MLLNSILEYRVQGDGLPIQSMPYISADETANWERMGLRTPKG